MDSLLHVDWHALLIPKLSLLEILLRGIATYVSVCLLLRVVLKRQAGKVALSDLLVVTLVAGICRNPLIADAYSLTDSLGVVVTVLGTSYALDVASYYSPSVHRLFHPDPVLLVRHGEIMRDNLRKERMTESQLHSKLRMHGLKDLSLVDEAWMENSGDVSVVKLPKRLESDAYRAG